MSTFLNKERKRIKKKEKKDEKIEPKEKETKRQKIRKNHGASSTAFGKFSSKSAQTLLLGHKK